MVTVKSGETYMIDGIRKGTGKHGEWALFTVWDDGRHNSIAVFCDNPGEVVSSARYATIVEIKDVNYGHRKVGEKWFPNISIRAIVEAKEGYVGDDEKFVSAEDNLDDLFGLNF